MLSKYNYEVLQQQHERVLILVLMEYALEAPARNGGHKSSLCLNPCFNGICSRRNPTVQVYYDTEKS